LPAKSKQRPPFLVWQSQLSPPFSKTFCVRFPERLNILQNYKKSHSLRKEWDRIFQQKNVNAQTLDFVQEKAGQM